LFFSLANILILHEIFFSEHDNQEGSSHVFTPYISKESNGSKECESNNQKVLGNMMPAGIIKLGWMSL
jgi:hypothetical protein